ncbi:hypothetical protein HID58_060111, partial [Brassica napus]
ILWFGVSQEVGSMTPRVDISSLNPYKKKSATRVLDNGRAWQKPPMGFIKCNLGCSWSASSQHTGASWVIWDF